MNRRPYPAGLLPIEKANIEAIMDADPITIGIRIPILPTSDPPSGDAMANTPGLGTINNAAAPTE